jgi:hypothetical protein
MKYTLWKCNNAQSGINYYSFLEFNDGPKRQLAGKPESWNAGMLIEHGIVELPSFPAS